MMTELGDIVRIVKPMGPVNNKDYLVAYSSPILCVLFDLPELKNMSVLYAADLQYVQLMAKGRGVLEDRYKMTLGALMKRWPYGKLYGSLGRTMEHFGKLAGYASDQKMYINISGFVPSPLAMQWKQVLAMADIYKQVNPEAPDAEKALLEWMLITVIGMISNYDELKDKLEDT